MFNFSNKTKKILKYGGAIVTGVGITAIILSGSSEAFALKVVEVVITIAEAIKGIL